jgi:hypothetical protein
MRVKNPRFIGKINGMACPHPGNPPFYRFFPPFGLRPDAPCGDKFTFGLSLPTRLKAALITKR